jgi:hypothetical protein
VSDEIGDDIGPDGLVIPDEVETRLAFRTWRLSENGLLLSINAPSLTGKAGGNGQPVRKISWIHRQLADPEGQNGWPIGDPLVAHCGTGRDISDPDHGPIPAKTCTCGVYATTSISVINQYLGTEVINGTIAIRGPVLGVVELGGRIIPATQGYRARGARIAAILLIDTAFTLPHAQLKQIAERYQVPALIPHSLNPEDYRDSLAAEEAPIADQVEDYLKQILEDGHGLDEGGEE